jgi:hypothetical protein
MRLKFLAKHPLIVDGVALPAGTYDGRGALVFTSGDSGAAINREEFTLLLPERELVVTANVRDGSLILL